MPLTPEQHERFKAVCSRIAAGESVISICKGDNPPMGETTFYRWLLEDEEGDLRKEYAHAREVQAERYAEEIVQIADDARNDWMASNADGDAGWKLNGEHVQRSKLRIDSRKWIASKLKPKVYGDRVNLSGDGEDGAIRITVSADDAKL